MRKTITLNSDEIMTLILLSRLNREILTIGLNKQNTEDLKTLQSELMDIVHKSLLGTVGTVKTIVI